MDDGGPLDITDLSLPSDQSHLPTREEEDVDDVSDEAVQAPIVVVSPYPTPKRGILKHTSQRGNLMAETAKFEHRFDNLEQRINHVDYKIESVKSHCENGIREIKQSLTPAKNQGGLSGDIDYRDGVSGDNREENQIKVNEVSFSQQIFRPFDHTTKRKPLRDRTNSSHIVRDMSFHAENIPSRETIVRRGYSALNRAKNVQRKIDKEFELGLNSNTQKKHFTSTDDDDVEAAEIVSILKTDNNERLTHDGIRIQYMEKSNIPNENRFNDYRLKTVRGKFFFY